MKQMRDFSLVETTLEEKMFVASVCSWDFRLHTEMQNIKDSGNVVTCLLETLVPFERDVADWF